MSTMQYTVASRQIPDKPVVGTGLVLQDESFRMNPCPNSKADSHKGCPYSNI